MLFALPLLAAAASTRRWEGLGWLIACGLPCVVLYLAYNAALTGNPLVLPRSLFDASRPLWLWRRHRLPPPPHARRRAGQHRRAADAPAVRPLRLAAALCARLAAGAVPDRATESRGTCCAGAGALAFVLAYVAYFYHGIALGPRYYFEALPWMLILAGRGAQRMAQVAQRSSAIGRRTGKPVDPAHRQRSTGSGRGARRALPEHRLLLRARRAQPTPRLLRLPRCSTTLPVVRARRSLRPAPRQRADARAGVQRRLVDLQHRARAAELPAPARLSRSSLRWRPASKTRIGSRRPTPAAPSCTRSKTAAASTSNPSRASYMTLNVSYTSIDPPLLRTGQPFAFWVASDRLSAFRIESAGQNRIRRRP